MFFMLEYNRLIENKKIFFFYNTSKSYVVSTFHVRVSSMNTM